MLVTQSLTRQLISAAGFGANLNVGVPLPKNISVFCTGKDSPATATFSVWGALKGADDSALVDGDFVKISTGAAQDVHNLTDAAFIVDKLVKTLRVKLDAFTVTALATPTVVGTGDGTMNTPTRGAQAANENVVVTFTDATHFNVVGSVTGALGSGTTGVAFTSSRVNFTITAGVTPFAAADTFTIVVTKNPSVEALILVQGQR